MRCSRKSTTWCASAVAALALVAPGSPAFADGTDAAVRRAIAAAVVDRMGPEVQVAIDSVRVAVRVNSNDLLAVPEPGAHAGEPCVFSLSAPGGRSGARRRIGSAVATVRVSGPHTRTTRTMARGDILAADDLVETTGSMPGVPFAPVGEPEALAGARLLRDLGADSIVTPALVQVVPLVRSGDVVTVRARVGRVIVEGRAVASENGTRGEIIRLVNPDSRRTMRGRVTGRGEVEVLHES